MKRRIKRIAPLQAGKMLGLLYACIGLIFLPFFMLAGMVGSLTAQSQSGAAISTGARVVAIAIMLGIGVVMPIVYGVMGFVFAVIVAAI
jgi:hypothetical protein